MSAIVRPPRPAPRSGGDYSPGCGFTPGPSLAEYPGPCAEAVGYRAVWAARPYRDRPIRRALERSNPSLCGSRS